MNNPTPPDTPSTIRLLAQWKLLLRATKDPALSRVDLAIVAQVIDRYVKKKGDAWSSYEMLAADCAVHRYSVPRSIKRLVALGYLEILSGGRRGHATVFLPKFDLVLNKGSETATETDSSTDSDAAIKTPSFDSQSAIESPQLHSGPATSSYLPDRPTKAGLTVGRIGSPDAALPPPSHAPDGADGGDHPGFEEVWRALGVMQKRPQAKIAWEKLNPDAATAELILASAGRWSESYRVNDTESKWRVCLHNFIGQERYLEDPPLAHQPTAKAKRKAHAGVATAIAPVAPVAAQATPSVTAARPETSRDPLRVTIVAAERLSDDERVSTYLKFKVQSGAHEGQFFSRNAVTQGPNQEEADAGERDLKAIRNATGIGTYDDLVGRELVVTHTGWGGTRFMPAAANDDVPQTQQGGALRGVFTHQ